MVTSAAWETGGLAVDVVRSSVHLSSSSIILSPFVRQFSTADATAAPQLPFHPSASVDYFLDQPSAAAAA